MTKRVWEKIFFLTLIYVSIQYNLVFCGFWTNGWTYLIGLFLNWIVNICTQFKVIYNFSTKGKKKEQNPEKYISRMLVFVKQDLKIHKQNCLIFHLWEMRKRIILNLFYFSILQIIYVSIAAFNQKFLY